jgi:predicted molibdopterin-dependent oxidoreductase YjgC
MPVMHIGTFVRGKGRFLITKYVATDEKVGPRFPLLLTTGRILSQYNGRPAAPTMSSGTNRIVSKSTRMMPSSAAFAMAIG